MRLLSLITACAMGLFALAPSARAEEKADALATVAKATATVEALRRDEHFPDYWQPSLAHARAVLIVPSFYKAGFFIGGAYGNGVLLVRNDAGIFSPPAFYRMAAGSLGLQFGAEEREIMYMIMSETGLRAIMEDKFKVGAGINLAIATFGGGAEAATTSAGGVDIVAFSHAAGAFGGGAIEGAGLEIRDDWNHAVYGANAAPKSILFDRRYQLPQSEPLINALMQASGPMPAAGQPVTAPTGTAGTPVAQQPMQPQTMPPVQAAPAPTVETQSLDAPSQAPVTSAPAPAAAPTPAPAKSSTSGQPVQLVPQTGNNLQ
jgi:lipid-binding SYLF domain-containing protein